MRTPAGTECPFYYADFHRGASRQACRLIERNPAGGIWAPDYCSRCSVPRILMANGCPNLALEARVKPGVLGVGKGVDVRAHCTRSNGPVPEPEVGCGQCHAFVFPLQEDSP